MEDKNILIDIIGNELTEDIFSNSIDGLLLLKKGVKINATHIELLKKHQVEPAFAISLIKQHSVSIDKSYTFLLEDVKEIFHNILQKKEDGIEELLTHFAKVLELALKDLSILDIIHQDIDPSNYIYQHSINVGIISAIIGKILGLSKKACHLLGQMGLFHDIGMLAVNPEILQKKERLTQTEYKEIQQHTIIGKSLLFPITQLDILISRTALLHHETINGKGYPNKRTEKDIPIMIQIITIADTFNSMCTNTYQQKKSYYEAINKLINSAQSNVLNPAIVIPFAQFIMNKQLFKKVKLTNNKIAEIIFIHQNDPHLPIVRIENEYLDLRLANPIKISGPA
ncbi:HD-GYP domain-containing protein [Niallia sp. NCCP-28]|uniref:HD-GYP domain-containing protein n=1 Tax=Niallia sp. NCCP-28 TaxID=2934712 RepID=UPI002080746F|nr:HD domain-containing phosphohydrolase [Niallia sp. NCCP-28]GKU83343.1 metal dependent phosphohydrolase [Niallia sp. NCCP-28]